MQGELAAALVDPTFQALDLSQPSILSASAMQKTSIVLLPPVNHPSLERQYNFVRLRAIVAVMARHQGLRAAGAAEVCRSLPATLHGHPHVRILSVVGKREVTILPSCVRVPGRTRVKRLRLLAAIELICNGSGNCTRVLGRGFGFLFRRPWIHLHLRVVR